MIMKDKIWYALYATIFVSIFLTATFFLFSTNHSMLSNSKTSFVTGGDAKERPTYPIYRTQTSGSSTADCINKLMNKLESGSFDLGSLRQEIENCFQLNSNNSNGTEIVPQIPSQNSPRFV